MKNNNPLLPDLRFPEFKNDGEWEEKVLEDILVKNSTKNKNSKFSLVQSVSNKYGFINQDEYFDNRRVASADTANYYVIEQGTFAYNPSRIDVGSLAYKNDNETSIISPLYVSFKAKKELIKDNFLLSWFASENFKKQMIFEGGVRNTLNFENLVKIKINIPKNPLEQQKIADCLSSLDALLEAHQEKLSALQKHKKGLLQNLFPQEDEKVPNFRFKEFENDGEWEEKTIDKIKLILTDYVANGSFQSLKENLNVLDSEDYAYYVRLTDLRAGLGHENQKYVDENTYFFLNKSSLKGGELLMANIGANVGEVWQMPQVEKPATLAPNMIMIKFEDDIDSVFVYQYLSSEIGVKNISSVISGSGHPKISKTDLKQIKVIIPPKLIEQQKIADTLSSLDSLIQAQTQKIAQLQQHKKGLLQGLFPKINE